MGTELDVVALGLPLFFFLHLTTRSVQFLIVLCRVFCSFNNFNHKKLVGFGFSSPKI